MYDEDFLVHIGRDIQFGMRVQEYLFSLGYRWSLGAEVRDYKMKTLIVTGYTLVYSGYRSTEEISRDMYRDLKTIDLSYLKARR